MDNIFVSSRLFARPSFSEGLSRVIDLGSTLQDYNTSNNENEADSEALLNDWRTVGKDIEIAAKRYEQKVASA